MFGKNLLKGDDVDKPLSETLETDWNIQYKLIVKSKSLDDLELIVDNNSFDDYKIVKEILAESIKQGEVTTWQLEEQD